MKRWQTAQGAKQYLDAREYLSQHSDVRVAPIPYKPEEKAHYRNLAARPLYEALKALVDSARNSDRTLSKSVRVFPLHEAASLLASYAEIFEGED
jgi:hypothetical protein